MMIYDSDLPEWLKTLETTHYDGINGKKAIVFNMKNIIFQFVLFIFHFTE